ncbi:conjugal transfer protein TraN [Candidatus Enterovibrio escicola]|uniref:conjugal transfer protein TraN n=1 Tax=Candidatus Enterovibrio escicola TaxID=1927127 RepID=UPI0012381BEE|nr:conjugal transfer protein TraN [Candidatus Enterovibrio escacola]
MENKNKNKNRAGAMLMIAVVICGISEFVFAGNTNQANSDGKAFADRINNSRIKDLGKSIDPHSIPNYQGTDVPEKKYYNSGLNIENEAKDHAASDPHAQYINSSINTRPKVIINSETDSLFERHEEITSKANSLTDSYSTCVDLPVGNKDVTAARHVSICGSQLVCPDGQCTSEFGQEYDSSHDAFKKAATALAVADEISKQLDLDNLMVFKGESKACNKKAAGFSNCCKDSGWGADIGLASCSNEEKELGLMKEAKRVHFVGDYCAKKVFGACIRKKYVYCTYPSKLSKILMEQGNAQVGRGYGGAKNPDCKGFTLTELENLNFDEMDLSAFYSDVMSNAVNGSTPNTSGAAQSIKDKLNARYPSLSEGDK